MSDKPSNIIIAKHSRINAIWLIAYEMVDNDTIKIHRIWRDDNEKRIPDDLCWSSLESGYNRIVYAVNIGFCKESNGIAPDFNVKQFKVQNPRNIFTYK